MSLAERSITSVTWNVSANVGKIAILLARSILLARLLPVETFGIYTLATSIVTFSGLLPVFGMGSAFLHRAPETADEDEAAAVHLTLRLALTAVWAAALIGLSLLFARGELRQALVVLTIVFAGLYLTDTPKVILARRVLHRRLAVLDLLNAIVTTIVALILAWRGYELTALLATDAATLAVTVLALYVWRPVWRPRLLWLGDTVRYYLRFGSRTMTESALTEALDNLDDIWTGAYLGNNALGLYSRAYAFATYPRRLLAMPVNMVAGGAYAELKTDRRRLSKAFFRTNALLVRAGFLLGGLLALVAPEFVRLALGDKWLPMVPALRLMVVFTLLDPIRTTVSSLYVAAGRPEQLIRVRLVQVIALIVGLFLLGGIWGITGVAVVVDVVVLLGLIPLLYRARDYVDFSARRLFAVPGLALAAGAAAALAASGALCSVATCPNDWLTGLTKSVVFAAVFGGALLTLERREVLGLIAYLRRVYSRRRPGDRSHLTANGR